MRLNKKEIHGSILLSHKNYEITSRMLSAFRVCRLTIKPYLIINRIDRVQKITVRKPTVVMSHMKNIYRTIDILITFVPPPCQYWLLQKAFITCNTATLHIYNVYVATFCSLSLPCIFSKDSIHAFINSYAYS